jgi:hypothetical protein
VPHKSPPVPFVWTLARTPGLLNGCEAWLFHAPISEIPVRRFGNNNTDEQWAIRHHGVDLDSATWTLTLQGRTLKSVAIQDIRVKIVKKIPIAPGTQVASDVGCGGVIEVRFFSVALDSRRPHLSPQGGAKRWPYSVSKTDIEELRLAAAINGNSHRYEYFYVYEIDWSQGDRTGTAEVHGPSGQPFELASSFAVPFYFVDNRRWKHTQA